jgi:AhpC/TSA family
MVLSTANICAFGWKARDFALKGVDGKIHSLVDVRGPNGTLIVFICNHCPYVKASIDRIVAEARALREIGIGYYAKRHRYLSRGLIREHEAIFSST